MSVLSFKKLNPILKAIQSFELTGILIARYKEHGAVLVFKAGQLMHAQLGPGNERSEGDTALYSLLSWEDGQLKWQAGHTDPVTTIDQEQEAEFYEAVEYLTNYGNFESEESLDNLAEFFATELASPAPQSPSASHVPPMPAEPEPLPVAPIPPMPMEPESLPFAPPVPARVVSPALAPALPEPVIAAAPATPGVGPAVSTLIRMGLPRLISSERFSLNSHFANVVYVAREVADRLWPQVIQSAQLSQFLYEDPISNDERTTPVEYLSQLNYGFEQVFGNIAPVKIREWGREATDRSIRLRKASGREQRLIKLLPGKHRKITTLLNSFVKSMDEVRGEHLHTWKQIDQNQFWLVHYSNLYALGRRRKQNSCYIWTASFEAMLTWAGLWGDWSVEEIECGCVTGTFDCVFAIRAVQNEPSSKK